MREQFKPLESHKSLNGVEKKRIKKLRLPDARGYNIVGGFAEKRIGETEKEHRCRFCKGVIPVGSPAREIIEVVNRKLLVHNKEYAHINKGQCLSADN